MTAAYPTSVKSFTTKVDFTDTVLAAHVNDLQEEVNSIEATLGSSIKTGSGWVGAADFATTNWNTVKDRITNLEYVAKIAYDARNPVGGTTGQVLVKNSSTNYDYSWTTFTGLPSQTSNSGKFLTTNGTSASWAIDATSDLITTAGDIVYGSAADTLVRLGIGTANQVLRVSSGGVPEWATPTTAETGSDNFTLMLMGA